jgi:hypothetical protein
MPFIVVEEAQRLDEASPIGGPEPGVRFEELGGEVKRPEDVRYRWARVARTAFRR